MTAGAGTDAWGSNSGAPIEIAILADMGGMVHGVPVPIQHGGPIRLRVERQCGYKSLKFISSMTLTDNVDHQFKDLGPMGVRYSWYAGI